MTYFHYSSRPLLLDRDRKYIQDNQWNKPNGLWLSHNDAGGWMRMCMDENFHTSDLKYASEVTLRDDCNLLVLESLDSLNAFINRYYESEYNEALGHDLYWIDWNKVIGEYDGIQVNQYDNKMTESLTFPLTDKPYAMPNLWYDALACDSTCIWNLGVISSITVMSPAWVVRTLSGEECPRASQ